LKQKLCNDKEAELKIQLTTIESARSNIENLSHDKIALTTKVTELEKKK